jgi:hypothetical protein
MRGAVQQADAADEAQGGTRTAGQGAALCPRRPDGRGHRFAADPQCSADHLNSVEVGHPHQRMPADGPWGLRLCQDHHPLAAPRRVPIAGQVLTEVNVAHSGSRHHGQRWPPRSSARRLRCALRTTPTCVPFACAVPSGATRQVRTAVPERWAYHSGGRTA